MRLRNRRRRADRLRPADVVGVWRLPPARLTTLTTRLRATVLSLHRKSAPPPLQIIESMLGMLDGPALGAFCALGLPELLDRPMTIDALAAATGADRAQLERLVQFALARGWVRRGRRATLKATRTTRFLRADHPGGWRAWVEFAASDEVSAAAAALPAAMRSGTSAFERAHGAPFFEWMAAHPERHEVFDRAMDAGGRMHALALAAALPWTTSRRVCDVGGGSGALLAGLLGAHPDLQGVLLDLAPVVARAPRHDRIEKVAGDAFVAVPPGCDTYLLVNVLHDWGDDEAVTLLTRVAEVLDADGRVVVVDGERQSPPIDSISARTDLLMLVLTATGKERSTAELAALGARAGLRCDHSVDLASGDRAHVFVRASD